MLYDLVSILNKHGRRTDQFRAYARSRWKMSCIPPRHSRTQAFLRDYYGLKNVDEMDDSDGNTRRHFSARSAGADEKAPPDTR